MTDIMSFITLVGVVGILIVMWLNMTKQSASLKKTAQAMEDVNTVFVKNRRDAHKQQTFKTSPLEWFALQNESEYKPIELIKLSLKPAWVNYRCLNGGRLVVSPLAHAELKATLNAQKSKSKLEQFDEPLLGTSSRNLLIKEKSLRDNEWFDLEANAIGTEIGMPWGEVTKLYFYTITPKEAKQDFALVSAIKSIFGKKRKLA